MSRTKIPKENNIIYLYTKEKLSLKKIGEQYNCSASAIMSYLKKNGIPLRTKGGKENILDKTFIYEMYYNKNMSINEISKKTNRSFSMIAQILRSLPNYKRKNQSLYKSPLFVDDYFKNIDTEFKAYILGFLITDGNISNYKNRNLVRLEILKEDEYILKTFKEELKSENKIYHNKNRPNLSRFAFESVQIVEDLKKFNIVPKKTFSCSLPQIDESLMRHFIRGCIDGDGWITKRKLNEHITIGFCGVSKLVEDIRDYLVNKLNITNVCICKHKSGLLSCQWSSKKDVIKISHFLYDNSNYFLHRKRNKILNLL